MPCAEQMTCFNCELYSIFQSWYIICLCHSMIPVACQWMITSAHHNAAIWLFQPQLSEHTVSLCVFPVVCQWADRISALTTHTCSIHKRHPCSHQSTYILKHFTDSTLRPQTIFKSHCVFTPQLMWPFHQYINNKYYRCSKGMLFKQLCGLIQPRCGINTTASTQKWS